MERGTSHSAWVGSRVVLSHNTTWALLCLGPVVRGSRGFHGDAKEGCSVEGGRSDGRGSYGLRAQERDTAEQDEQAEEIVMVGQGKGLGMGQLGGIERLVRLLGVFALVVSLVSYATGGTLAGAGERAQVQRATDSEGGLARGRRGQRHLGRSGWWRRAATGPTGARAARRRGATPRPTAARARGRPGPAATPPGATGARPGQHHRRQHHGRQRHGWGRRWRRGQWGQRGGRGQRHGGNGIGGSATGTVTGGSATSGRVNAGEPAGWRRAVGDEYQSATAASAARGATGGNGGDADFTSISDGGAGGAGGRFEPVRARSVGATTRRLGDGRRLFGRLGHDHGYRWRQQWRRRHRRGGLWRQLDRGRGGRRRGHRGQCDRGGGASGGATTGGGNVGGAGGHRHGGRGHRRRRHRAARAARRPAATATAGDGGTGGSGRCRRAGAEWQCHRWRCRACPGEHARMWVSIRGSSRSPRAVRAARASAGPPPAARAARVARPATAPARLVVRPVRRVVMEKARWAPGAMPMPGTAAMPAARRWVATPRRAARPGRPAPGARPPAAPAAAIGLAQGGTGTGGNGVGQCDRGRCDRGRCQPAGGDSAEEGEPQQPLIGYGGDVSTTTLGCNTIFPTAGAATGAMGPTAGMPTTSRMPVVAQAAPVVGRPAATPMAGAMSAATPPTAISWVGMRWPAPWAATTVVATAAAARAPVGDSTGGAATAGAGTGGSASAGLTSGGDTTHNGNTGGAGGNADGGVGEGGGRHRW